MYLSSLGLSTFTFIRLHQIIAYLNLRPSILQGKRPSYKIVKRIHHLDNKYIYASLSPTTTYLSPNLNTIPTHPHPSAPITPSLSPHRHTYSPNRPSTLLFPNSNPPTTCIYACTHVHTIHTQTPPPPPPTPLVNSTHLHGLTVPLALLHYPQTHLAYLIKSLMPLADRHPFHRRATSWCPRVLVAAG